MFRRAALAAPAFAFLLCVAALASSPACSGSSNQTCTPGAQVACACPGTSTQGAQVCNTDGTGYGACVGCPIPSGSDAQMGTPDDAGGIAGSDAATSGSGLDASSTTTGLDAGATAGLDAAAAVVVTIGDVTTGTVGPKTLVQLKGAVAMSQKFLIAKSATTGSCLWGVFVSSPGLSETAANSGILVASYGTTASIPDGGVKSYCPLLGAGEPAGDAFPDDVRPGDVLDLTGTTDYYVPSTCTAATDSKVSGFQISKVVAAARTGSAPVPAAHALSTAEITQLASATDKAFHDQWGGVKVKVSGVTSQPQAGAFTDSYGAFYLAGSGLRVGDKIYFRGWLPTDVCHKTPVEPATTTFTDLEGFSYLDYCTWSLVPNDKCADLTPSSTDCASATACAL